MWLQVPGKNKRWWWGWLLLPLALAAGSALAGNQPGNRESRPPAPPESEIIITGKFFCSLKRRVDLPFKGVITSVPVHSGQKVTAGETLATYRLAPESVLAIGQRLSPPHLSELEIKLAELERALIPLRSKQREIKELSQKKLAPSQSLNRINQEVQLVARERAAVQQRLKRDRQLARQDLAILTGQLGEGVKQGQPPSQAVLKAPMDGYVILVHPEMREGAEMMPTPAAFLVGVMDPMLVRAQAFEIEALQIQPGQTAELTLESLPGRKFQGRVSRVSWSSLTPGLEQPSYYEVDLEVPNPDLILKEGLKTRIVFKKSGKEAG